VLKQAVLAALILALAASLAASASNGFSGESTLWLAFDPSAGSFDAIDLEFSLSYTIDDVVFSSDSVIAYPGTWVWQAFSACGDLGTYGLEANILFGASTAEYLYAEAIASLSIGGIDFAFHAAQLSDAVFGGPEGGWALQLSGEIEGFDFVGVTEFGARIQDDDYDGISIVHIVTGLERHYSTDPRPVGEGFTGQKLSLSREGIFCADLMAATLYISCEGFEYSQITAEGLDVGLSFITLDTELRFELERKTLTVTPALSLGEIACFKPYGCVNWDDTSMAIQGIELSGLEIICELGPVVIRDVALFDLTEYVLTTERFGSRVMEIDDALEFGYDFYSDYWELLSIAVTGNDCCGGSYSFLASAYFDEAASSLFDWAMLHVEASIPLTTQVGITLGMETKPSGTDSIALGMSISW